MKLTRRTRTAHPLVTLLNRRYVKKGVVYEYHVARWTEVKLGKPCVIEYKLDHITLPAREARRAWAIAKSKELVRLRDARAAGVIEPARVSIQDAVDDYAAACARLRSKTKVGYELTINLFVEWCEAEGLDTLTDIGPAHLASLRKFLVAYPKRQAARNQKRGTREKTAEPRSDLSINRDLRAIKTALQHWRKSGWLSSVDRDAITDQLGYLKLARPQPIYLDPQQCKALLEACLRHDAECHVETREEHLGLRAVGTTRRYAPITPLVQFLLLTGCRLGEALSLKWTDVNLGAVDHNGDIIGALALQPENVKTKFARVVTFDVCPSIRTLLAGMKLRASGASVFDTSLDYADSARDRLMRTFGAPSFRYKDLRSSCETYLVNAPGIFGAASVYRAAAQLGHAVAVAQKHYLSATSGIAPTARTLEQSMRIEGVVKDITDFFCDSASPRAAHA